MEGLHLLVENTGSHYKNNDIYIVEDQSQNIPAMARELYLGYGLWYFSCFFVI